MASPEMDSEAQSFVPHAGHANLYVIRSPDRGYAYGFIQFLTLVVDGNVVGSLPPNGYMLISISSGHHGVLLLPAGNCITFEAVMGENYFVEAFLDFTRSAGGWGLSMIDQDSGRNFVQKGNPVESMTD